MLGLLFFYVQTVGLLLKIEANGQHARGQLADGEGEFVVGWRYHIVLALLPRLQHIIETDTVFYFRRQAKILQIDGAARAKINKIVEHFQQHRLLTIAPEVEHNAAASNQVRARIAYARTAEFDVTRHRNHGRFHTGGDYFVIHIVGIIDGAVGQVESWYQPEIEVVTHAHIANHAHREARNHYRHIGFVHFPIDLQIARREAKIGEIHSKRKAKMDGFVVGHGQIVLRAHPKRTTEQQR